MSNEHPVITLRQIDFSYEPERRILNGFSLDLQPGEKLALSGPIGAGKTTIFHLIVGLINPQRGERHILGMPRSSEADFRDVRRKTALLFQDPDDQLFCPTVIEDIIFGPLNLGLTMSAALTSARDALALLGIERLEKRVIHNLSAGEKRLVALATVLVMQPSIMLLDEPTTGLDSENVQRVTKLINSLPQSMIIISHDGGFLNETTTRSVQVPQKH